MPRDIEQLNDLLMEVLIDVPGCLDPVALKAIGRSARNFCEKTEIWTKKITMSIVDGQETYTPSLGEAARIERVKHIKLKTTSSQTFKGITKTSEENYIVVNDEDIEFNYNCAPAYDLTNGMELDLVLRPTMNNADIPSYIIDKYGNGIIAGAKAILMAQKQKPYSDPQGVVDNTHLYRVDLTNALNELRGREGKTGSKGLSA